MQAATVRDLGAMVRSARHACGMTQAELAERLGVSRDWVVRLEKGHPRLEAQRVLDALGVLGLSLEVRDQGLRPVPARKAPNVANTALKQAALKQKTTKAQAKKAARRNGPETKVTTGRSSSAVTVNKAAAKRTVVPRRTTAERDPFDALFQGH